MRFQQKTMWQGEQLIQSCSARDCKRSSPSERAFLSAGVLLHLPDFRVYCVFWCSVCVFLVLAAHVRERRRDEHTNNYACLDRLPRASTSAALFCLSGVRPCNIHPARSDNGKQRHCCQMLGFGFVCVCVCVCSSRRHFRLGCFGRNCTHSFAWSVSWPPSGFMCVFSLKQLTKLTPLLMVSSFNGFFRSIKVIIVPYCCRYKFWRIHLRFMCGLAIVRFGSF